MQRLPERSEFRLSNGTREPNTSITHVRLTEAAQFALENYSKSKCITVPRSDEPGDLETFKFNMSNISKDNNPGSFECIQQTSSGSEALQLKCLGTIQNKITVSPTSESYQATRERMIQAEEDAQKRSKQVARPGGPSVAKRKLQTFPNPVPKAKISKAKAPAVKQLKAQAQKPVSQQPYKDRVIHLLALRSYKKPELLFHLQKDGIYRKDKNCLGKILNQVAFLNPKDNSYFLKDFYFTQIRNDWPGYTDTERQSVELILSRKLNAPQDATSSTAEQQPATAEQQPATAEEKEPPPPPSHKLSWSLSSFDPLLSEKLQKAKQSQEVQNSRSPSKTATATCSSPSCSTTAPTPPPCPSELHPISKLPQTATSSSSSSPMIQRIQELPIDIFASQDTNTLWGKPQKYTSLNPFEGPEVPPKTSTFTGEKPALSHQKPTLVTEHKEEAKSKPLQSVVEVEKWKKKQLTKEEAEEAAQLEKWFHLSSGVKETCTASKDAPSSTSEQPDYLLKYVPVVSQEQCQSYENDFNAEFDEYRRLHAQIDAEVKKFTKFQEQWKLLSPGSQEYMALQKEITDEYQKLQQSSPSYSELKRQCEYLHKKLSYIKSLVEEFDRQQGKS